MNDTTDNAEDLKITASEVPEGYRLGFLPRHFGRLMMIVEAEIYNHMGRLAREYHGSYWWMLDLSNGGCFMHPVQSTLHIAAPNGFEAVVAGEVAGIIATLYALSHLSFDHRDDDVLSDRFHQLREFALQHPQAATILEAID